MKFRAVSLFLTFAIGAVCAQAQVSAGAPQPKTSQLQSFSKQVDALTAQVSELRSTAAALQAKVDELVTLITPSLAGTYALVGIQNELDPLVVSPARPAVVGAYVYTGIATIKANGTGSFSLTQSGSYLVFGQSSLTSADATAVETFDWTYANNIVTLSSASDPSFDGATFNVALGGQVWTHADGKISGTDNLTILTRLGGEGGLPPGLF
jgi:hypothetical protein